MTPSDADIARLLRGERLTTANVLYYLPDSPSLLQEFVWQTLDLAPEYPRICRFLDFWRREIDAVIHSVSVGSHGLVAPPRLTIACDLGRLH